MKPLSTSRTREATGAPEHGAMGVRAVNPSRGVDSQAQSDAASGRQHSEGGQPRPREERELDEQRRALASLILGVFEADPHSAGTTQAQSGAPAQDGATPPRPARNPLLEPAIVEFMYALFQALDEIDDAEPTLAVRVSVPAHGASSGRSAFGERIDHLGSRIAASNHPPLRLASAHAGVVRAIHGEAGALAQAHGPRHALAALLRRLANAMHVAPTLGYGSSANAGAMLRVRA